VILLAVDPGSEKSGWVTFDGAPVAFGIEDNGVLISDMRWTRVGVNTDSHLYDADWLVVEMIESRGMPVGKTTHETTFWAGRFVEAFHKHWSRLYRREVKMHLCGSTRAKDGNIRQVLIDRWGGKEKAIGRKASPGPLYGIKADIWQALALAVTWWDKQHGREA
jgi:hypothetical protein